MYLCWSSYRAHAFVINARSWSPQDRYRGLGKNDKQRREAWRDLTDETLDIEVLAKVRHCVNTGLVLGTESFREQVHRLRR